MPDGQEPIAVKVLSRLDAVAAAEWDACAGATNDCSSAIGIFYRLLARCLSASTRFEPELVRVFLTIRDQPPRSISPIILLTTTLSCGRSFSNVSQISRGLT